MNKVTPAHESGVAATRPQTSEMRWKRVLQFSFRPPLPLRKEAVVYSEFAMKP
jgi:hypothetical protein